MTNIAMPANVIMLFNILIPLVTFDILDDLGVFEEVFPDSEEDSEPHMDKIRQIRDLGYSSFNIFLNNGTFMVLTGLYFLKIAIVLFILKPLSVLYEPLRPQYTKLKNSLFFSDLLHLCRDGYMEYLISSLLLLYFAPLDSVDNQPYMVILSYTCLALTIIFMPVLSFWVFSKNLNDI